MFKRAKSLFRETLMRPNEHLFLQLKDKMLIKIGLAMKKIKYSVKSKIWIDYVS